MEQTTQPPPVHDAYALPLEAAQEPPSTLWLALRQIGPGLIMAGSIVGTGELIATTHLGAKAGFALLWLVLLSCFIKVFVQAELGRYTISSGQTTLAGFREIGGGVGSLFGWWWLTLMLFTQLQLGAMIGGVGQAFHMALPDVSPALAGLLPAGGARTYLETHSELPWAVLTYLLTAVLLAIGSYKVVEHVTAYLVMIFTFATIVCVVLLPMPVPWGEVGRGFTFQLPETAVVAALAMFGITGVGATELVAYPYWCIEKGYARKTGPRDQTIAWLGRARGWMRVMKLDVAFSLVVYTAATLAFYFLGAATLKDHPEGLPSSPGGMLNTLAGMYAPVMGERGATLFMVAGVFAVLYSTLFAASAANARVLADFIHVNSFVTLRTAADRTRWVRWFCVVFLTVDLVLYIGLKNPVKMVVISGIVQALTLPMLGTAALFLRYKRTDPRLRPGMLWDAFLWLSSIALLATAVYGFSDSVGKFFKK